MRIAIALVVLILFAVDQTDGRWEPQPYLISSPASANLISAQSSPFTVKESISKAASPQSSLLARPAQTPPSGFAPTTAASPDEEKLAQLLRGFVAVVEQDIEELKASMETLKASIEQLKMSQEQIVRDNAAVAEQLKATQEQIARLIASNSERQLRSKTSTPPLAAPTQKPPVKKRN